MLRGASRPLATRSVGGRGRPSRHILKCLLPACRMCPTSGMIWILSRMFFGRAVDQEAEDAGCPFRKN
jgi:hypothetical protein